MSITTDDGLLPPPEVATPPGVQPASSSAQTIRRIARPRSLMRAAYLVVVKKV
jgi:hypothetical protein